MEWPWSKYSPSSCHFLPSATITTSAASFSRLVTLLLGSSQEMVLWNQEEKVTHRSPASQGGHKVGKGWGCGGASYQGIQSQGSC